MRSLMRFIAIVMMLLVGLLVQLRIDGEASPVSAQGEVERQTVPTRTFTPEPATPTVPPPTVTATPVPPPATDTPPPPPPTVTDTPLPPSPATNTPVPTTIPITLTVITDTNVYSGPGFDSDVVGSLEVGDTAYVLGRNADGSWWQIRFLASAAWIADSAVTVSAAVSDVPEVVLLEAQPEGFLPETLPKAGGGTWLLIGGMFLLANGALLFLAGMRVRRRRV